VSLLTQLDRCPNRAAAISFHPPRQAAMMFGMNFTLRTLLLVVAAVSVWSSTFTMDGEWMQVGIDIRSTCRVLILVWGVASAIYRRGAARAFWIGFTLTWLLFQCGSVLKLFDDRPFDYVAERVVENLMSHQPNWQMAKMQTLESTLKLLNLLCVSTLSGGLAWLVYSRSATEKRAGD
jgi:hypothetical protein